MNYCVDADLIKKKKRSYLESKLSKDENRFLKNKADLSNSKYFFLLESVRQTSKLLGCVCYHRTITASNGRKIYVPKAEGKEETEAFVATRLIEFNLPFLS